MKLNFNKLVIVGSVLTLTVMSAYAAYWDSWRLTVQSNDYHWALMHVPTDRPIRLVRKLSKAPCDYGRTWGITDRGIWVDHGCRAVFDIAGGRPRGWRIVWDHARFDGDRDHDFHDWRDGDVRGWDHHDH